MNTIEEYNQNLAECLIKHTLEEYFNIVHNKYYNTVDISFMGYFLSIISKKNEFCVEHQKLIGFGIIKEKGDNTNIKSCITNENYGFKENIDYIILTPERSGVKRTGRGGSNGNAKHYNMKPKVFKKLLMRSKNENKYSDYYLMLEEIHYYYEEYQNLYNIKLVSMKDDKIDSLEKKIDKQSKDIEELLKYGKYNKDKLDEVQEELDDVNDKFDNLNDKVDDLKDAFEETANRSVPDPVKENDKSEYILLQSKDNLNEFIFIRGIKEYNDKKMTDRYNEDYEIVAREFNSNPIQLLKLFKKTVKDELKEARDYIKNNNEFKGKKYKLKKEAEKIKINSNKIELLNNFTKSQLLNKIKRIAEIKFETYNESTEDIP